MISRMNTAARVMSIPFRCPLRIRYAVATSTGIVSRRMLGCARYMSAYRFVSGNCKGVAARIVLVETVGAETDYILMPPTAACKIISASSAVTHPSPLTSASLRHAPRTARSSAIAASVEVI